jgi:hypothetical protein
LKPTPGFELPPYRVEKIGNHDQDWHAVCNANGFNCLSFPDKPGAKFTTRENAERICAEWNRG